jgi:hypothetical protein
VGIFLFSFEIMVVGFRFFVLVFLGFLIFLALAFFLAGRILETKILSFFCRIETLFSSVMVSDARYLHGAYLTALGLDQVNVSQFHISQK